jgi:aryl-alcohol dehydrogenase-like predicted oxidoreductase
MRGAWHRVLPWSPLGQGFSPARSVAASSSTTTTSETWFPHFSPEALEAEANQPIVDLVKEIADRTEATPAQVALAWPLAEGNASTSNEAARRLDGPAQEPRCSCHRGLADSSIPD